MKKILILSANPKYTTVLRLDEEVREIENALKLSKNRDKFEIVSKWAVQVEDLRRALLDEHKPNIVHFSGHGVGKEGLVFENESGHMQMVSGESLANLFELLRGFVECVLLNACYSEVQAQAIHQYVDCVIGMNQPIGDKAAIEFATGFYDALGAGENYDYAFRIGCNSIELKGSSESSTPVIKYRPSSVYAKNTELDAMEQQSQESNGDNFDGGQKVGDSINPGGGDNILGGNKITFGGDNVAGDKVGGDKFYGDKVGGDKVSGDKTTVGNITGNTGVTIGSQASTTVNNTNQPQNANNPKVQELENLLEQLQAEIKKANSGLTQKDLDKLSKHLTTIRNFGGDRQNSDLRNNAETALDALPTILSRGISLNRTYTNTLMINIKENLSF